MHITIAALLTTTLLTNAASPQSPRPAPAPGIADWLVPIHTAPDDPDGGAYGTWAAGTDYKVSLGREVGFYPVLGASAPRHLPVTWHTRSVRHGDRELLGETAAPWHAGGYRFEIRYGDVTEAYDVRSDGVEQTFIVARPHGAGDLVVAGSVRTDLTAVERAAGHAPIDFGEDGEPTVRYGAAFAVDARGERIPIPSAFAGGEIRLRVPAAWLATATWPVTIDPLLSTLRVSTGAGTVYGLDVARDDVANQLLTVMTRSVTGADSDAYAYLSDDRFSTPRPVWTDVTTSWSTYHTSAAFVGGPRRWAIGFPRRFATTTGVRVHLHDSGDPTVSTTYVALPAVAGQIAGHVDVGGTTGFGLGDAALLVYVTDVTSSNSGTPNSDVYGVLLDARNRTFGQPFRLSPTPSGTRFDRELPDVNQVADDGWVAVFEERDRSSSSPDPDVMIARVRPDGTVVAHGRLEGSSLNDVVPRVAGRDGRYLVTYGVVAGSTSFPWNYAPEIAGRRVDWELGRLPNFGPKRTLFGSASGFATWTIDALAYDDTNRSYWELVTTSNSYRIDAHRIGYDVRVVERVPMLQTGVFGGVTYNDDAGEFVVVHPDRQSRPNVWGSRVGPPQGSIARYGTGCGTATIGSRNIGLLGSQFFTVTLSSAAGNQPAILFVAPSAGFLPLDSIGMRGCTLLVSTTDVSLSTVTNGARYAERQVPIPGLLAITDLRFQWLYFAPGANPLGLQTTAGLDVRPQ